jgi:hypothetical protein
MDRIEGPSSPVQTVHELVNISGLQRAGTHPSTLENSADANAGDHLGGKPAHEVLTPSLYRCEYTYFSISITPFRVLSVWTTPTHSRSFTQVGHGVCD